MTKFPSPVGDVGFKSFLRINQNTVYEMLFPSPVGDVGFKSCRWNPLRDNGETGFCGADGKTLSFVNRKVPICSSNPYTASRGADYVTTTMDLLF